jgi:hypothetical protein
MRRWALAYVIWFKSKFREDGTSNSPVNYQVTDGGHSLWQQIANSRSQNCRKWDRDVLHWKVHNANYKIGQPDENDLEVDLKGHYNDAYCTY